MKATAALFAVACLMLVAGPANASTITLSLIQTAGNTPVVDAVSSLDVVTSNSGTFSKPIDSLSPTIKTDTSDGTPIFELDFTTASQTLAFHNVVFIQLSSLVDTETVIFAFQSETVVTPLPAALPLFATGLGGLGLLGWRRKRKTQAVA